MKKVGIFDSFNSLIDVCRLPSVKYDLVISVIHNVDTKSLFQQKSHVKIDINLLVSKMEDLINKREININPPVYGNRFTEEQIFEKRSFKGNSYKLCRSGYDNRIIFLLNIYERLVSQKDTCITLILFNNFKEFRDFLRRK